jgi:hypothetical protein
MLHASFTMVHAQWPTLSVGTSRMPGRASNELKKMSLNSEYIIMPSFISLLISMLTLNQSARSFYRVANMFSLELMLRG